LLQFGDAGVVEAAGGLGQAAGLEGLVDVGIIAGLMTAGLPRRFLANGGALMVGRCRLTLSNPR
jgi:hypothetical protein